MSSTVRRPSGPPGQAVCRPPVFAPAGLRGKQYVVHCSSPAGLGGKQYVVHRSSPQRASGASNRSSTGLRPSGPPGQAVCRPPVFAPAGLRGKQYVVHCSSPQRASGVSSMSSTGLRPSGAADCSHGWSGAATKSPRNPWYELSALPAPAGAEEPFGGKSAYHQKMWVTTNGQTVFRRMLGRGFEHHVHGRALPCPRPE
jgi:hypothetical protein